MSKRIEIGNKQAKVLDVKNFYGTVDEIGHYDSIGFFLLRGDAVHYTKGHFSNVRPLKKV